MKPLITLVLFFFFATSLFAQTTVPESISICRGKNTFIRNIISESDTHFVVHVKSLKWSKFFFYEKEGDDFEFLRYKTINQIIYNSDALNTYEGVNLYRSVNGGYILMYDTMIGCDVLSSPSEAYLVNKFGVVETTVPIADGLNLIAEDEAFNLEQIVDDTEFTYNVKNEEEEVVLSFNDELLFDAIKKVGSHFLAYGEEGEQRSHIKFFSLDGETNIPKENLAVTDIEFSGISVNEGGGMFYANVITFSEVTVTVENIGETNISEFVLSSRYNQCPYLNFCSFNENGYLVLDELDLDAGKNQTFSLPAFSTEVLYAWDVCLNSYEFCVSVVSPNGKIDTDFSDNTICVETMIETSNNLVEEQDFYVSSIINNELIIEIETPKQVEIWCVSGKRIYGKHIFGNEIIATNNWQAGMYIVNLSDDKGNVNSTKVMKN